MLQSSRQTEPRLQARKQPWHRRKQLLQRHPLTSHRPQADIHFSTGSQPCGIPTVQSWMYTVKLQKGKADHVSQADKTYRWLCCNRKQSTRKHLLTCAMSHFSRSRSRSPIRLSERNTDLERSETVVSRQDKQNAASSSGSLSSSCDEEEEQKNEPCQPNEWSYINKKILAPMVRVGLLPFRLLCLKVSCIDVCV